MRQAVALRFDAEPFAGSAETGKHVAKLIGRPRALSIGPDADVADDRGVLRLAQIGGARQQSKPALGPEIEALEEAEAEAVIAGQVIHALLLEHQQAIKPGRLERGANLRDPRVIFAALEM